MLKHFIRGVPLRAGALVGAIALIVALAAVAACKKPQTQEGAESAAITVFVPGVTSGSPTYEMLVAGVRKAALDFAADTDGGEAPKVTAVPKVTVIEGGYNQAEWEAKMTAIAASGSAGLIVSSNPSLPAIVAAVHEKFPRQRFLLLDGELSGIDTVYTLSYKHGEQARLAGYYAALLTKEMGGGAAVIGLVAAQEYPEMNNVILPGYLEGARAVDPRFTVDFRGIGNWFDAGRASMLAAEMIHGGVKVILTISGGANEGVVQTAAEQGARVIWFDNDGYAVRPGVIAGSAVIRQEEAARDKVLQYLRGGLPFGAQETVGLHEGYVDFIASPDVSASIREQQNAALEKIRAGQW
jgi:simple sugar transport system substrate-binding protein